MNTTDKLIITPKKTEEKPAIMTVYVPRAIRTKYDELSLKTNVSRHELASMALQFALKHMEIQKPDGTPE